MKKQIKKHFTTLFIMLTVLVSFTAHANKHYQTPLDLWYDLEPVTEFSATYSTQDSYLGDFHYLVLRDALTLTPGYPEASWQINDDSFLSFYYRTKSKARLIDVTLIGDAKTIKIEKATPLHANEWTKLTLDFEATRGLSRVNKIILTFDANNKSIEIDNVLIKLEDNTTQAITDKPLGQRLQEAKNSREIRREYAFKTSPALKASKQKSNRRQLETFFVRLWLAQGKKLKNVNQALFDILSSTDPKTLDIWGLRELWNLSRTHFLIRTYNTFSANSDGPHAGKLEKRTEDALLNLLWNRTVHENDIYNSIGSTFRMDGSENHDLDSKIASLLSSKIFMNHPDYKDKVLPNKGKTGTWGYWFHRWGDAGLNGPDGLANWRGDDTKTYTAKDNYLAWVGYLNQYIIDRVQSGFFLEKASGHYMTYTIGYLLDAYNWSGDTELTKNMKDFLDVIWAEWAIDQLHGLRGGSKTRYRYSPKKTPDGVRDAFSQFSEFYFGGRGHGYGSLWSGMLNDYEVPESVWLLAFNRKALGSFVYKARSLGESTENFKGEPGLERTIVNSDSSRLLRYSYITPDYILGTQLDHPGVIHNHLSIAGRMQGMLFAEPRGAMAWVKGTYNEQNEKPNGNVPYNNTMLKMAQDKNVAIYQGARRVMRQSPAWFPNPSHDLGQMYVGFEKLANISEENGWIFASSGNAYLAVRVVDGVQKSAGAKGRSNITKFDYPADGDTVDLVKKGYQWERAKNRIKLDDKWSGVIFEAGSQSKYGSMDNFKKYILGNKVTLYKTVVMGYYYFTYEYGENNENMINFNLANMQISRINGEFIDYQPPLLWDSPFFKSVYKSGEVEFGVPTFSETRTF